MININDNALLQESDQETAVEDQRRKQAAAIEQLRHQLEELESYAYMSGDSAGPPSRLVLDRQRLVMEQLRDRSGAGQGDCMQGALINNKR